jgi:hypothetical protein
MGAQGERGHSIFVEFANIHALLRDREYLESRTTDHVFPTVKVAGARTEF